MLIAPRSCRTSSAAIVSRADAALGEGQVLGDRRVEVVAHHQHVEVLVERVDGVGHRRVGRRRQDVRPRPTTRMMSGAWPPPAPSVWKVADRAALDGGDGVLDEARFVERVGVDRHLHVGGVGHVQAVVDRRRRGAPVLVQLQADGAGLDLLVAARPAGWRCPCPGSRGSSGRRRPPAACARCATGPGVQVVAKVPVAGPVPPPSMVVTPRRQRLLDLLRADEVDVAVDAAGGDDHCLRRR